MNGDPEGKDCDSSWLSQICEHTERLQPAPRESEEFDFASRAKCCGICPSTMARAPAHDHRARLDQPVLQSEHDDNLQTRRCTRSAQEMDWNSNQKAVVYLGLDPAGVKI
ncbi:hypothetical protein K3495_g15129 [Podosphaera aphanis]|nr:hypothetical protein K3495_g15129 [Podosphaera aphanis]